MDEPVDNPIIEEEFKEYKMLQGDIKNHLSFNTYMIIRELKTLTEQMDVFNDKIDSLSQNIIKLSKK